MKCFVNQLKEFEFYPENNGKMLQIFRQIELSFIFCLSDFSSDPGYLFSAEYCLSGDVSFLTVSYLEVHDVCLSLVGDIKFDHPVKGFVPFLFFPSCH